MREGAAREEQWGLDREPGLGMHQMSPRGFKTFPMERLEALMSHKKARGVHSRGSSLAAGRRCGKVMNECRKLKPDPSPQITSSTTNAC